MYVDYLDILFRQNEATYSEFKDEIDEVKELLYSQDFKLDRLERIILTRKLKYLSLRLSEISQDGYAIRMDIKKLKERNNAKATKIKLVVNNAMHSSSKHTSSMEAMQ